MRKVIAASFIVLLTLAVISCQKEIDWGTGNSTPAQQLVKVKSKTGTTDSSQVDYSYDAAGRLTREITTGVAGGISLDNQFTINRNSSEIITTTVQKSAALVLAGIDSIETRYYYNSSTSKYTAAVFFLGIPGFAILDSALYTYDASGRITKDEHYTQVTGLPLPLPPILSLRNTYTYSADGKNLLNVTTDAIAPPATTLSPLSVQTYTADTKVNPLIIVNEAIVLSRPGLYSANNPTRTVVTNTVDPSQDFTMDYRYIYNSSNKPDSSYGTRTPGGAITASKLFYQ